MEKRTAGILLLAATLAPVMVLGAYQMRHSQRTNRRCRIRWTTRPDAARPGEFAFARLRYRSGNAGLRRPLRKVELGNRFQPRRPAVRSRHPPPDPRGLQVRRRSDRHR